MQDASGSFRPLGFPPRILVSFSCTRTIDARPYLDTPFFDVATRRTCAWIHACLEWTRSCCVCALLHPSDARRTRVGRHLSTGVAEGVDASERDDPSWQCLPRLVMHGTHLSRGFLSLPFPRRDGKQGTTRPWWFHDPKTETGVGRHPHGAVGWEEPMPRPRNRQGKGQRMRCPSLTPKRRSVAPEWCPLPTPPPPPPYNPGEEEEKKETPRPPRSRRFPSSQ